MYGCRGVSRRSSAGEHIQRVRAMAAQTSADSSRRVESWARSLREVDCESFSPSALSLRLRRPRNQQGRKGEAEMGASRLYIQKSAFRL